jgi:leader peptidase (prepilin peptidase)/N-methyltransferase
LWLPVATREAKLEDVFALVLTVIATPPATWLALQLTRRYCPPAVPAQGPLVMGAALTAVFLWASLATPPDWVRGASLALGWILLCLAIVDLTAFRLPDAFTFPLIVAGLAVAVCLPGRPVAAHLVGLIAGWGALAALAWAYERARGVAGVGAGDAKLLGAAGAWLGWQALPAVLVIACGVAFVWIGVLAMARGRQVLADRIAFGAPLCLAFWIVWLHGPIV